MITALLTQREITEEKKPAFRDLDGSTDFDPDLDEVEKLMRLGFSFEVAKKKLETKALEEKNWLEVIDPTGQREAAEKQKLADDAGAAVRRHATVSEKREGPRIGELHLRTVQANRAVE